MQKRIKRFQRLASFRKKDVSKEINNSHLVQNEINKNESLIEQINNIMESNKNNSSNKVINSGYFKNNYLLLEKETIRKQIVINNLKKVKAEEKAIEYKRLFMSELEKKSNQ